MDAEPLQYPVASGAARRTVAILAGIVLGASVGVRYAVGFYPDLLFLVGLGTAALAAVLLAGACVRILVDPEPAPPRLILRSLLRPGLLGVGLSSAVLAVPVAILLATVVAFTDAAAGSGDLPAAFLLGSTMAMFAFLGAAYLLPALLAAVVRVGGIRRALRDPSFRTLVRSTSYLQYWTAGFTLLVLGASLASVTVRSGGPGGIVAAVGGAYLLVAGVRAFARGYEEGSP